MTDHIQANSRIHERRWLILAVLCLSLVLTVAGNSSLNVALPSIQRALGSSQSELQWMVDAYSLVFAGLLLPAGALADRFGRKWALQGGLAVYLVAALAATVGSESWHLIAARAVMGLGAAFIMPGTLSILNNVFTDMREKQKAIATWAGFAGLGGALGPVISGLLLRHFDWGSVFFINVVICAIAILAGMSLLPNSADPKEAKLDPVGSVLAVIALTLVLYGIIEAPEHGWTAAITLATLAAGLVFLGLFAGWERHTDHPMLDVNLFRIRAFNVGSVTITLQFFASYGFFFVATQYFQIAHGYSPLTAAFLGLPVGIFSMISAPMSARMVGRFGARRSVGTGLIISTIGVAMFGWTTPSTPMWVILIASSLIGIGLGQTTAPSTTLIMTSVPRAKSGVGSAVNDLSRELGGAIGIAVLGSFFSTAYQHRVSSKLAGIPGIPDGASSSVFTTMQAAQKLPAEAAERVMGIARMAFSEAFGISMLCGAAVLLLNSVLVWVRHVQHGDGGGLHVHEPTGAPGPSPEP